MSRPVEVLEACRRLLAPGGTVIVVDEKVAERFTVPGDEVERLMYGYSVFVCLANGLADPPSAGTGTVMRPDTVRALRGGGGFRRRRRSCRSSTRCSASTASIRSGEGPRRAGGPAAPGAGSLAACSEARLPPIRLDGRDAASRASARCSSCSGSSCSCGPRVSAPAERRRSGPPAPVAARRAPATTSAPPTPGRRPARRSRRRPAARRRSRPRSSSSARATSAAATGRPTRTRRRSSRPCRGSCSRSATTRTSTERRRYRDCFGPSWGRFKDRIELPVPGNHEYETADAAGYSRLLRRRGRPRRRDLVLRDIGAWHVVVLDSTCTGRGRLRRRTRRRSQWLRDDLAASDARCTLALFHHPRFSSGDHGTTTASRRSGTRCTRRARTSCSTATTTTTSGSRRRTRRAPPTRSAGSWSSSSGRAARTCASSTTRSPTAASGPRSRTASVELRLNQSGWRVGSSTRPTALVHRRGMPAAATDGARGTPRRPA